MKSFFGIVAALLVLPTILRGAPVDCSLSKDKSRELLECITEMDVTDCGSNLPLHIPTEEGRCWEKACVFIQGLETLKGRCSKSVSLQDIVCAEIHLNKTVPSSCYVDVPFTPSSYVEVPFTTYKEKLQNFVQKINSMQ